MKKITFKELQDLIAGIDYLNEESFPVRFSATAIHGMELKFECGITTQFKTEGECFDEYQYFEVKYKKYDVSIIVDLQDPDDMSYDDISKMLNKHGIDETCDIYLHATSFTGKRKKIKKIPTEFTAKVIESHTQADLTDETKKGLDYLKDMLRQDIMLISTKNGEFKNLNGMRGESFAFIFSKKVLYYDKVNCALCTYCPYTTKDDKKFLTIRIESNDKFQWILLNVCTGENLLSSFKPCWIKINDTYDERIIEGINAEKINAAFEEAYEKVKGFADEVGGKEKARELYNTIASTFS